MVCLGFAKIRAQWSVMHRVLAPAPQLEDVPSLFQKCSN
jgi:hypothetical protein